MVKVTCFLGFLLTCYLIGYAVSAAYGWWGFVTLLAVPFVAEFWDWVHDTVAS